MRHFPRTPRFEMSIPLRVRALSEGLVPGLVTESLNVSATGLLFSTNAHFENGMTVDVFFRMPEEVLGYPSNDWHCRGQVVRIEKRDASAAGFSVGVKFHWYEILRQQVS